MIVPDMSVWRCVLVLVAVFVFDRADAAGCSKGSDCTAVQGQYCNPTSDQCMDTPAGYVRSSESKGYTICGAGSFTHHDANNLRCQACVPGFTAPRGSTNIKQCRWQDDKKPTEVHPLQTFFDSMDTDGSRSIDTEELFATMKAHGFESITTLDGARHWVIFYDSDNNGKVDWNEFTGAYTNVEESMTDAQVASKTMQMTDTNKDGKISQDEAEAMKKRFGMVLTDSYQNLLKADTDSDGQVSEDELVEVFKHRHPAELDIMETLSSEIDFKILLVGNGVDKDRRLLPLPKLGPLFQKQNVDGRHDQFGKWLTPASAVSTECMLNDTFAALRNAGVYNSGNCSITVQEAAYGTFSITVWSTELATLKLFSEDDYAHCQKNTYETRAATFTWTPPRHVDHEYEATFYALCQPVDLAMANASAEINFQVRQRLQVRMATGTMTTTVTATNTSTTIPCAPIPTTQTTTWACGPPVTTTIGCGPGHGVGKDVTITVSGGRVQDAVVKQEAAPALGFPFGARFVGVGVASLATVALLVAVLWIRGNPVNEVNEETMEALVE